MPRKTSHWRASRGARRRFNEAAARCRGKRRRCSGRPPPRWPGFNEAAARCRGKHNPRAEIRIPVHKASMRPRPDAAENHVSCCPTSSRPRASMRPRPDAAENEYGLVAHVRHGGASMRPRPDAAENPRRGRRGSRPSPRFNEAAARCRGKLASLSRLCAIALAGFNEAAARCRGKHADSVAVVLWAGSLQ